MQNTTPLPTLETFKAEAKALKKSDKTIKTLGEALNILAVQYGFQTWNIIKRKLPSPVVVDAKSPVGTIISEKIHSVVNEIHELYSVMSDYMLNGDDASVDASNHALEITKEKESFLIFLNSLLDAPVELPAFDEGKPFSYREKAQDDDGESGIALYRKFFLRMKNGETFVEDAEALMSFKFDEVADQGEWVSLESQAYIKGRTLPVPDSTIVYQENVPGKAEYYVWGVIGGKDVETFGSSFVDAESANSYRDWLKADLSRLSELTERDIKDFDSIETRFHQILR